MIPREEIRVAHASFPLKIARVYFSLNLITNNMAEQLLKVPKDLFKNVKFYLAEEGNDKVMGKLFMFPNCKLQIGVSNSCLLVVLRVRM